MNVSLAPPNCQAVAGPLEFSRGPVAPKSQQSPRALSPNCHVLLMKKICWFSWDGQSQVRCLFMRLAPKSQVSMHCQRPRPDRSQNAIEPKCRNVCVCVCVDCLVGTHHPKCDGRPKNAGCAPTVAPKGASTSAAKSAPTNVPKMRPNFMSVITVTSSDMEAPI